VSLRSALTTGNAIRNKGDASERSNDPKLVP
jgi:hypothetical protein